MNNLNYEINSMNTVEIYTDGACSGNPGPGGWAFVIIVDERVIQKVSGGQKDTTNNRMEMTAVIEALKYLQTDTSHFESHKISIYTDSKYVQQGISSWIHNWKKNNWKTANKGSVKNKELWQELDTLSARLSPEWNWVKGHSNNQYNELCDKLAVSEIKKS